MDTEEPTLEELNRLAADYLVNALGVPEELSSSALTVADSPLRFAASTLRKLVMKRLRLQARACVGAEALAADATTYAVQAAEGRLSGVVKHMGAPMVELGRLDARIRELDEVLVELAEDLRAAAREIERQRLEAARPPA